MKGEDTMKDNEIKLNASGYKDEPCYKTIKKMDAPKPGEIWDNGKNGKTVLVLGNMNGICSILNLIDQEKEGCIKVQARVPMYTAPIMVSWCFTSDLTNYVMTSTLDDFNAVKWGVTDALGLTIGFPPPMPHGYVESLEQKVKALEDERDAAVNVADQTHADNIDASIQLEKEKAKAQFYREMYDTLLDKLISMKAVSANE